MATVRRLLHRQRLERGRGVPAELEPFWYRSRFESPPWRIRRYVPGAFDRSSYGGFGRRQVALLFVATRGADSTGDAIPQQS